MEDKAPMTHNARIVGPEVHYLSDQTDTYPWYMENKHSVTDESVTYLELNTDIDE